MIEVFGVRFATMSELIYSLGYAKPLAKNFIINQYGSIEKLVTTRLRVTDKEAPAALLQARDTYRAKKEPAYKECQAVPEGAQKSESLAAPEHTGLKAFLRVLLAEVSEDKKESLFKLVALSLNKSAEKLKKELEDFLKS